MFMCWTWSRKPKAHLIKRNHKPINQGQEGCREKRKLGTIFILVGIDDYRLALRSIHSGVRVGVPGAYQRLKLEKSTTIPRVESKRPTSTMSKQQQISQIKENYY
jgi:hypothetical protein